MKKKPIMPAVPETSSLIQDLASIITALAAVAGLILAVMGFSTWRDQLRGRTDYELARRYLRAAYKVRDSIRFVRNPFITVEESNAALKEADLQNNNSDHKSTDRDTQRAVYAWRWKEVKEAVSDLKVELLEAEVSWGKEAIDTQKDLHACMIKIFVAVKSHLGPSELREKNDRDLIYDCGEDDEFNKSLNLAVEKIERYLAPHLR